MASKFFSLKLFLLMISSFAIIHVTRAVVPDMLPDFLIPQNATILDGNFFTFTGFRSHVGSGPPTTFKVLKVSMAEFPALNGQSVSLAVLEYANGTINPPHIHPRSAELLFLVEGTLQVGFVDTTNKLFTQKLQEGDLFVFPKGLVHFQYNADPESFAIAVSAFGSANPGTVSIPNTLFTTGIDDTVLAKSFKTNIATIQALKLALATKP